MKSKMKVLVLAIAVGILTLLWVKTNPSAKKVNIYSTLAELPGFDVKQVKGQYLLIHFWAKWCEPCADEIPHLVEFTRDAKLTKPLEVLAISLDQNLDESKTILPEKGAHLPANFLLALDPEHKIAEKLGSFQYPETYFVNPEGDIIEKWIGAQKWNKPEVLEFFKQKVL